jgi:alpha-mannosidase
MLIKTRITLSRDSEQLEVQVDFENRHEDHYLRVLFPTGLAKAEQADVGGHFAVDHRPVRPAGPTPDSYWPDMGTQPQHSFVDLSDGEAGIAFLNDSLTEYEVLDNAERTVALSLLRATHNWICTETRVGSIYPSQKGGQCLGAHRVRYAIRPHAGRWQAANVPLAAEQFNVPVRLLQTRAWQPEDEAMTPGALFEIENPGLRFSALKQAEDGDGWVLRIFNPTAETQSGGIRFFRAVESARACNLDEVPQESLTVRDGHLIETVCAPGRIVTIKFRTI